MLRKGPRGRRFVIMNAILLSFTVLDNPTTISLLPDLYRKKTLAFDCVSVAASIFFINLSFLFPKTLAIHLNNPSPLLYVVLSYYQRGTNA
jgi:hypothetical protein